MHTAPDEALALLQLHGVQLFGAGGFARALASALRGVGVPVQGFLTSSTPAQTQLNGLPVRCLDDVVHEPAAVAVAVFNREAHSDYAALHVELQRRWPRAVVVWPQQLYGPLQAALGFRFWLHDWRVANGAEEQIDGARALFADDPVSLQAFDAVIAFRRQAFWAPPSPHDDMQYLPRWLDAALTEQGRGALHIVDAGAYHGETLHELATRRSIAQAWTFEPDPANYARLVQALRDWPAPLTHLPAAVGERCATLPFSSGGGEASHLGGSDGTLQLPVLAIDDALHCQPIDFIKLDVEGHELQALRGAVRTLRRCRPTLAIAAYHRWDDLWTLPAFVAGLGLDYRLRLGLHGHNSFDAVLYAV